MERVKLIDTGLNYDYNKLETRRKTDMVVIHHTGNPTDDDLSAQAINTSHQAQGWVCIGYHYVIRKDGTVELGRPHWTVGAHAYGENSHTIGIHVCGNFEQAKPTAAQIESLAMLLSNICTDYGLPIDSDHIAGHRDLMSTACPGKNLYQMLQKIIGKSIFYQQQ
ncbi:peptidoglycan recognition family protein [Pectinatus frisingensis]|uniref:peptidoglycan recognition protein family protein n=1 Tax=Pectinatus frisingensis TaxID=865 RepID=UPI0018C8508B|nr:peptidoglycan recognition family protein [Pectinatus frisingensis]